MATKNDEGYKDMKSVWVAIQIGLASFGGWLGYFLGGFDGFVYTLLVFVILDYVTGLMSAIVNKKVSSSIGFRGIFKKIMIFAMVMMAHFIDTHLIGNGEMIRTAVIFFYAGNEGISILENAAEIGLPIPQKLKDILSQIRKKGDDNDDDKPDDM